MKASLSALGAALALATAHPTRTSQHGNRPTRTLATRDEEPSNYYGAENGCTNEPKYFHFDTENNDVDGVRQEVLHDAVCRQIPALLNAARHWAEGEDRTIFNRFFNEQQASDDLVQSVQDKISGRLDDDIDAPGPLSDDVGLFFTFDNTDFLGACAQPDADGESVIQGYTAKDPADGREKTHFCDNAWSLPKQDDVACDAVDPYPSRKMETFARVMLHQFLHYGLVGADSDVGAPITDVTSNDGLTAYYPARAHALVVDHPELTKINADNHAWFAQNAYMGDKCLTGYVDPPPYTAGTPGDPV